MSGPVSVTVLNEIRGLSDEELAARVADIRSGEMTPISYPIAKEHEDELARRRLIRLRTARTIAEARASKLREPDTDAARRLGDDESVTLSHLDDQHVRAVIRHADPLRTADVAWNAGEGWSCGCPPFRSDGDCRHAAVLRYVTQGLINEEVKGS